MERNPCAFLLEWPGSSLAQRSSPERPLLAKSAFLAEGDECLPPARDFRLRGWASTRGSRLVAALLAASPGLYDSALSGPRSPDRAWDGGFRPCLWKP